MKWSDFELDLGGRTHVMAVLNVTPDSFSDGGLFFEKNRAVEQGLRMAEEGADIIDVGGESTRPYSEQTPEHEELERVIPVIEALSRRISIPISIDTYKSGVALEALGAGASMINDITALRGDPLLPGVAADAGVPVVLMHMKGSPKNMQVHPEYDDLMGEIAIFLQDAVERAVSAGIDRELTIIDPGIGFGKSFDHNLEIIRDLSRLKKVARPILLGSSRKAFIGRILGKKPLERGIGTLATVVAGVMNGAGIVRVHDVKTTVEAVRIADAIKRGRVDL